MFDARMSLESLELLSQEKSSEKRRQLLNAVTDVFLVTQDQQSAADGEGAEDASGGFGGRGILLRARHRRWIVVQNPPPSQGRGVPD